MYFTGYFCMFILTTSLTLSNEIRLTSISLCSTPAFHGQRWPSAIYISNKD